MTTGQFDHDLAAPGGALRVWWGRAVRHVRGLNDPDGNLQAQDGYAYYGYRASVGA